jgi:hypothetical protein
VSAEDGPDELFAGGRLAAPFFAECPEGDGGMWRLEEGDEVGCGMFWEIKHLFGEMNPVN